MNYRTAQTADLPAMMKMVEEAKEGFRARNIDQWQKGEPNEQGLTEGIEKSVVHVLEENGEVLGMITVVPGPEADYAVIDGAWLNDEPYFAFHRVCVSEAHKGKGLAASLFSYSEAFAKENGVHFIDASKYGKASVRDGVHMEAEYHEKLGKAFAEKVKEILG